MMRHNLGVAACAAAVLLGWAGLAGAQQSVVLYTSNEATLNKLIASEFEKETGISVNVIAPGVAEPVTAVRSIVYQKVSSSSIASPSIGVVQSISGSMAANGS